MHINAIKKKKCVHASMQKDLDVCLCDNISYFSVQIL